MGLKRKLLGFHRKVVDPNQKGVCLALVRAALSLASAPYGVAVRVRNQGYDSGRRPVHRAGAPVISVGNITAGGTGKTPFAAMLVAQLRDAGHRPAILSRGYGRDATSGLDDENEMLRALAPGVPVVVDPDRVRGAARAVREHKASVLVLDDGFQHRRLARDLDIVLIDALAPFGAGHMLPRGLLREPLSGLARAGLMVLTRSDLPSHASIQEIRNALTRHAPGVPVALAVHRPGGLRSVGGGEEGEERIGPDDFTKGPWAGFCGIGNPEAFRLTLVGLDVEVARFTAFPDHHRYTAGELESWLTLARDYGCRAALTTEKDAIKIRRVLGERCPLPVLALEVRLEVTAGQAALDKYVQAALGQNRAARR